MDDLYNTVLSTYTRGFYNLRPNSRFHFASRLYLWNQQPITKQWLDELKPDFTGSGNPRFVLEAILEQPLPALRESITVRAPYFERYPRLINYSRVFFRLLFMYSVYDLDERALLDSFFNYQELKNQRDDLLNDMSALAKLSTFAINFLYILERFINQNDSALPLETFLEIGENGYDVTNRLERQLKCYFYTHCIIAESLFYSRNIPLKNRFIYLEMLRNTESLIGSFFADFKLDNKLEFLVCCRMLDYSSPLEPAINQNSEQSLSKDGYLVDPLSKAAINLRNSEHRNVLFLTSQRPYTPLRSA